MINLSNAYIAKALNKIKGLDDKIRQIDDLVDSLPDDFTEFINEPYNILNESIVFNYNMQADGTPTPNSDNLSIKYKVKVGERYGVFRYYSDSIIADSVIRASVVNDSGTVLESWIQTTNDIQVTHDGYLWIWIRNVNSSQKAYLLSTWMILKGFDGVQPTSYIPYQEQSLKSDRLDREAFFLKGKNLLTYGDSITAINNDESSESTWGAYVKKLLKLNKVYGRGVGGQTFKYNTSTFKVNENGEYVSRGGSDDNCLGCFCSWQRITSMIPTSIKNSIDVIYIMGGTNDVGDNTVNGTLIADSYDSWKFMQGNTTDTQWSNSNLYNGGDFNVNTFQGAIASTIMKIQKWCPNALVILGTPLSGRGNTQGNETDFVFNRQGKSTFDYANAMKEVASMMSIPCVDVYSTCGINQFNRASYIYDSVHPYDIDGTNKGNKALARAVASGLSKQFPSI